MPLHPLPLVGRWPPGSAHRNPVAHLSCPFGTAFAHLHPPEMPPEFGASLFRKTIERTPLDDRREALVRLARSFPLRVRDGGREQVPYEG
jgi:hypothetical protein